MIRRVRNAPAIALLLLLSAAPVARAADNAAVNPAGSLPSPAVWTLGDVTDIALKNHPLMKQAESDIEAAVA
ncbi:MAG: hypothetical protein H6Q84_3386, partial [Deltaproteobacteria bacterium]|nr:hypothetical protein [Deltaproteobacteria bacterium]